MLRPWHKLLWKTGGNKQCFKSLKSALFFSVSALAPENFKEHDGTLLQSYIEKGRCTLAKK